MSHVDPKKLSPKQQEQYGQSMIDAASKGTLFKKWNLSNKERIRMAGDGLRHRMEGKKRAKMKAAQSTDDKQ